MSSTTFDITYELGFDGEIGSVVSIDACGHLPFTDAELFLADTVARELCDAGYGEPFAFGLEIEHLWRSEHPFTGDDELDDDIGERWTYTYTAGKRPGAVPVTRFQIAHPWARPAASAHSPRAIRERRTGEFTETGIDHFPLLCIHHPDEPAVTAIPAGRFIDPAPESVIDGHVHYCGPCHATFNERMRIATEKAMAPVRTRTYLDATSGEVISTFPIELRRADVVAVLEERDADGSSRSALITFADAYRAAAEHPLKPIAVNRPGYQVLMLSDIEHLVADYTHRSA